MNENSFGIKQKIITKASKQEILLAHHYLSPRGREELC